MRWWDMIRQEELRRSFLLSFKLKTQEKSRQQNVIWDNSYFLRRVMCGAPAHSDLTCSSWTGKCLRRATEARPCFKRICGSKHKFCAHLIPPKVNCTSEVTSEQWKSVRLSSTHGHAGKYERGSEYSTGSFRGDCNASGPWDLQCRTCPAPFHSLTFHPAWKKKTTSYQSTCIWQHITQTPACQAQLDLCYYWPSTVQTVYWFFDQGGLGEGSTGE